MKETKIVVWKKYIWIIFSIFLLLITTLFIIALAYINTKQSTESAEQINASARLSVFAQNIKNSVYDIDIYAKEIRLSSLEDSTSTTQLPAAILQQLRVEENTLNQSVAMFDRILVTFMQGGEINIEGGKIHINALQKIENVKLLEAIDEVWQPYQRLIDNFGLSLTEDKLNFQAINYATDYARIFNDRLSALAEKITDNLSQTAAQQNKRARNYLTIGFIVALLIASYLVFIAFRQLIKSDQALMRSQRELNDIMDTITEGLFLIDARLRIGEQYSAELENILRTRKIANQHFTDLLKGRVTDKDIHLTEGFLEQLFNKRIYGELITSLNPLSRLRIINNEESRISEDIYLSFTFHRVYVGKEINNILVTVRDITENVLLEKSLEQERIEGEAKLEMLSTILQVDADLMNRFINNVEKSAQSVNSILKSSKNKRMQLKTKLNDINRIIHGLKGEASALRLDSFTNKCEAIEDEVGVIRRKTNLTGNDFLGLTVHLDALLTLNDKARHLFERVSSGKLSTSDLEAETDINKSKQKYLSDFANEIAQRNGGKSVEVSCKGLDNPALSTEHSDILHQMSIQFLRNAVVHGIETPQQRQAAGKNETGQIAVHLQASDEQIWRYAFSDDGQGIDFEKLRQIAVKSPRYKNQNSKLLSKNELIRLMFDSGISTTRQSGEDAGRGVGMDIIRESIKQLNGKLQIYSKPGSYTRFIVKFPK